MNNTYYTDPFLYYIGREVFKQLLQWNNGVWIQDMNNTYYTDPFLYYIGREVFKQLLLWSNGVWIQDMNNTYYTDLFLNYIGREVFKQLLLWSNGVLDTRYEQYLLHGSIFILHWERSFQTTIIM
ncbi:uncharacterized protein OCT59_018589 [Rhizophagus irregularis]|uniref:uncharacterized protein n=1 Tax=Rhizophagus irregularis TaxID=588596 RepID=UPI0019EB14B7|nr:hypothetical protein OCT59_018589 [Rhizophagus irregularis]GET54940.1 hypothetical protein RIR_jg9972.t1 [Rhizophagus irregularis DAOM 181602=DAOM 197198]CAG8550072.1 8484_t:CDS:1 [Rhizophagus irregularis]